MADFGNLGGIYGGFLQGQDAQLAIQQKQQAVKAFQDDQDSLALLGNAFGVPGAQPPPPGQASQPRPPQGIPAPPQQPGGPAMAPGVPIGVPAPPPGSGGPQGPAGLAPGPQGPPQQGPPPMAPRPQGLPAPPPPQQGPAQPQPGVGGLSQGPQPQPSPAPPQQQGPQAAGGMLSLDQLTQRIVGAPGNREKIQANPGLLVRALEKGQALLAPEGRAELAQAKQDLAGQQLQAKIDQANQKLELGYATLDNKTALLNQANGFKMELERLKQTGADKRQTEKLDAALTGLLTKLAGQKEVATLKAGSAEKIAADHDAVRKELGDAKNLNDTKKIENTDWYQHRQTELKETGLADAAVKVQLDHEVKLIQEKGRNDRAEAKNAIDEKKLAATVAKSKSGDITDEEADFYAKALKTDPAMVLRLMGAGGAGTAAKQRIAKAFIANGGTPEELAKAEVVLTGKKAGAQTAERQGAKVDIGAEELKTFGPQVEQAAKAANLTKYPTWNAVRQAAINKTGGPEAVALNDAITNYRNALIQVAQRGGATSEGAQARADKYLNPTMSIPQILAAIRSGTAEAEVAQGAVKKVTSGLANSFGDKPAAPAADDGDKSDPAGIR